MGSLEGAWESAGASRTLQVALLGRVHLGEDRRGLPHRTVSRNLRGHLLKNRFQLLAVAAPRRVEEHAPARTGRASSYVLREVERVDEQVRILS